ncbi:MAG: hypothetical protein BGO49_15305 [Planctomycetales bacterium 71-10]|nr:MAG: hypothetical protein BGO49_15305 [Planctomycetales bacterium 71-10]
MFVRCPYCHKLVLWPFFGRHRSKHTALRADGQMNEHVTLRPTRRYAGSLEEVPQNYRHPKCGVVTGMPEEIIRSYLADPFLYGDKSFCCGCGDYVSKRELFWIETGQSLADYTKRLQQDHVRARRAKPRP